jgi:formylglycine-generating enzyme required for sulfatase activity
VELSPFFLSKFEMFQGPWERITGRNPSEFQRSNLAPTLLHPVERITWEQAHLWLQRMGLSLPSEAQWEYGARGGTDTAWWTGQARETLVGAANLADQAAARGGAAWKAIGDWPELDDGFVVHARIGALAPNPFGLHELPGNVWEWCLDGYDRRFYAASPRLDPLAPFEEAADRVNRGGGHADTSERARSANRSNYPPTNASPSVGVRPACRIRR